MPGAGTKPAITTSRPFSRLLDLTRLMSRVGRGPWTGVDRVEYAYLCWFLKDTAPLFALIRTSLGFVLLDRAGALALKDRLDGNTAWGQPDLAASLSRGISPQRRAAESDLRRLAHARASRQGLTRMLVRRLPAKTVYFNTGHSNLTGPVLRAVKSIPESRAAVLIHDTIPLDFPQFQRAGTPEKFARKLELVGRYADLIIGNSHQTVRDVVRHLGRSGPVPATLAAHLGVKAPVWEQVDLPDGLCYSIPYFVTVGTIEPRKNHALLLDLWESFQEDYPAPTIPKLLIAGGRGWNNEALFQRLDRSPMMADTVFELPGLGDGVLAALVRRSNGLLFPSFAEGFGLPPLEAAALGTPVVCGDLAIYREVLGNTPVYAALNDRYQWRINIIRLAEQKKAERVSKTGRTGKLKLPTWDNHFNLVLGALR